MRHPLLESFHYKIRAAWGNIPPRLMKPVLPFMAWIAVTSVLWIGSLVSKSFADNMVINAASERYAQARTDKIRIVGMVREATGIFFLGSFISSFMAYRAFRRLPPDLTVTEGLPAPNPKAPWQLPPRPSNGKTPPRLRHQYLHQGRLR